MTGAFAQRVEQFKAEAIKVIECLSKERTGMSIGGQPVPLDVLQAWVKQIEQHQPE